MPALGGSQPPDPVVLCSEHRKGLLSSFTAGLSRTREQPLGHWASFSECSFFFFFFLPLCCLSWFSFVLPLTLLSMNSAGAVSLPPALGLPTASQGERTESSLGVSWPF